MGSGNGFHRPILRRSLKRIAMWAFCRALIPASAARIAFDTFDLRGA